MTHKCLEVTKICEEHCNHSTNLDIGLYPEFRRPDSELVAEVNEMFDLEVKSHFIRERMNMFVKTNKQDLQNLR